MYPYRREATPPGTFQYPRHTSSSNTEAILYPGQLNPGNNDWLRTPSPQKLPRTRKRKRKRDTAASQRKETYGSESGRKTNQHGETGGETIEVWQNDYGGDALHSHVDLGLDTTGEFAMEDEDGYLYNAELDMHVAQMADNESSFETYVEMVTSGCAKFIQITKIVYVVQGWKRQEHELSEEFYHLEARNVGDHLRLVCLCPDAKKDRLCVHQLFYLEFRDDMFHENEQLWSSDKKVIMFWRQLTGVDQQCWLTRFSVASHTGGLNGRAIVSYEGADIGGGTWRCSKDRGSCEHTSAARHVLRETLNIVDEEEQAESQGDGDIVEDLSGGRDRETAISFLPIMPPQWASLPTDPMLYKRADPTAAIPETIMMIAGSARACCTGRPEFDPTAPRMIRRCKIYTYTACIERSIEVQRCPNCPPRRHCFIGPDPRDLGIFNYNNSVLFSHELLDEYTNRSGTSETPFAAFVQCCARVYQGRNAKFVGEDLLREAWFAYATLMHLTADMMCPKCGQEPENVIFDGVTLSFHKKHVTDTLQPPTYIDNSAPVRHRTYPKTPQWLPASRNETPIRERFRVWLKAQRPTKVSENITAGSLGQDQVETRESLEGLAGELEKISSEVACLTRRIFGGGNVEGHAMLRGLRRRYITLLEQLAGEESAMQMVNESALERLKGFVQSPTEANGSALVDIPALLLVLEGEMRMMGSYTPELLGVCRWMAKRAEEVFNALTAGTLPPLPTLQHIEDGDNWRRVSYYPDARMKLTMRPRRERAMVYPKYGIGHPTLALLEMANQTARPGLEANVRSITPPTAKSASREGLCAHGALIAYATGSIAYREAKAVTMCFLL
ncbi:hypothetical protein VNI00_014004 [Paramarasmius palmivorus]|uniref:HMG domain-containing protein n=1 Tax=Paramarasmius palmivorus TaxID=297713 RepID=A0AAW0BXG1_9AGAR